MALTANGTTSAAIVFTSPRGPSMVKTGTKVTCGGTIKQAITSKNALRRPRNRSLASA